MEIIKILTLLVLAITLAACSGNEGNNTIEATGTIESKDVTISSKNMGEIKSIFKGEGEKVNVGDTLLVIDNESLLYQLEQAIAAEQIANAQLNLMLNGARQEDIKQAEETKKQAETNFHLSKSDFERYQKLWESKSITKKQFEEVTARFQIATAQLASANENYEKIKKIFRPEEIEQAKANLKKSKAMVEQLKKNIRDSYVVSPIDGILVKKFVEIGETVSPMSSLVKLSNLSTVNMLIYVSTVELGKIKLGKTAEISIDTYPERKYLGKVIFISPEAEFTPKNIQTKDERTKLVFAVKIEIPNKNYDLKPGMPADAKIIL
ncbi:MAG: efflux RND transporter periplasmic adaptor subunit [Bacteroidota bacterium]